MREIKIVVQIDRLNLFSDIWLKYYTSFFESKNFYFIYENRFISDEKFKNYLSSHNINVDEVNLIPLSGIPYDVPGRMDYMNSFVSNLISGLLDGNTVIIYPDIDELIYHDNLLEILQTFDSDYLVTNPIDVVQNINLESNYLPNINLFEQRKFYINPINPFAKWYIKNNIVKSPTTWGDTGRHIVYHQPTDGLYLIHLGKFDYEFLEKLNFENLKMYENQHVNQNGFTGEELKNWYNQQHSDIIEIPENLLNKLKNFNL